MRVVPIGALNDASLLSNSFFIDYISEILSIEIGAYKKLRQSGKFQNLKAIGTVAKLGTKKLRKASSKKIK